MGQRMDLIGQRFGRLVVLECAGTNIYRHALWKVVCDCGNVKIVRGDSLKCENTKSCGCLVEENSSHKLNLVNKKFGRLLVIKECGRTEAGLVKWFCRCNCGNEVVVSSSSLTTGHTKSCGCYSREIQYKNFYRENNPRWKGGITPKNKLIRQLPEYNDWRIEVFKRDNYICQTCGKRNVYVEAHHIYPFSEYIDLRFKVWNGITLCRECHDSTKSKESEFVERFLSITTGYKTAGG